MPDVDTNDILRVVNKATQPVEIGWDSKFYHLEPNQDSFVPFPAIANAFGDPRSGATMVSITDTRGVIGWVPDRATEVRRLRAKYDNQFGDERRIESHPQVEVYTLDGERVTTVVEDPDGTTTITATPTISEQADLHALVKKQQDQIDLLMKNMAPIQPVVEPVREDESVPDSALDLSTPPEDTGGDFSRPLQTERTKPEKGSPSIAWDTLSGGQTSATE